MFQTSQPRTLPPPLRPERSTLRPTFVVHVRWHLDVTETDVHRQIIEMVIRGQDEFLPQLQKVPVFVPFIDQHSVEVFILKEKARERYMWLRQGAVVSGRPGLKPRAILTLWSLPWSRGQFYSCVSSMAAFTGCDCGM